MKRLTWLLTISSLVIVLVSIERFSFTTDIILQPYSFLRLHELIQMTVLILASAVVSAFMLYDISGAFQMLKSRKGLVLSTVFIVGLYFYATGNGVHEVASYMFNTFCDVKKFSSPQCGSMYFNDYIFGNILYFIGAFLMNGTLIILEITGPRVKYGRADLIGIVANALVYSLAIFAYAAFDRVSLGLAFACITVGFIYGSVVFYRRSFRQAPFTTYCAIAYTVAMVVSVAVRYLR